MPKTEPKRVLVSERTLKMLIRPSRREQQLEKALRDLIEMYVANRDHTNGRYQPTSHTFISCITPPSACDARSKNSPVWKLWRNAMRLCPIKERA